MRTIFLALTILAIAAVGLPASAVPDAVPDRIPGLGEIVTRGELVVTDETTKPVSAKVVDGDITDWVGESAMIGGRSHYDRGELIHTDFVWDAHGADAGEDIERWNTYVGVLHEDDRTNRVDDLMRTLDMQLGVPYPIGADEMYGNVNGDLAVGDLSEVRLAADEDTLHLLVRTGTMIDPAALGLLILADADDTTSPADPSLGLPEAHRFDTIIGVNAGPLGTDPAVTYATNADGYTNAVEIALPLTAVQAADGTIDLTVISGGMTAEAFIPHNIAFRGAEPIDIYTDQLQAFALHGDAPDGSHLDDFSTGPIDPADLAGGRTQSVHPGPGYHERQFRSGEEISQESGRDGTLQPYGMYVPSDYDPSPDVATPVTFWLHYRGGKAHSGATINPRMIHELAREDLWTTDEIAPEGSPLSVGQGNIVVTPHARGTSYWYVSQSHQDFFEVFADVHELMPNIDSQRRYLSGYSMGGYGTYLLGLLYPDLFAAGYPVSGAVTQGAWTGVKDSPACGVGFGEYSPCFIQANSGDASAQLTHRILDNARHFPLHIDHGTDDELVPVTGVQAMAARLMELGYRVEMQTFPGYEHFSQAAVDEWVDGTQYMQRFTAPENPRQVTYRVVPALVEALNTIRLRRFDGAERFDFNPDGAYWVDDIVVRGADPHDDTVSGLADVVATGIPAAQHVTAPVTGTVSPGHSTPFTRHGLDWLELPTLEFNRPGLEATLTGVASLTIDGARAQASPVGDVSSCSTFVTDGPATVTITGLQNTTTFILGTSTGGLLQGTSGSSEVGGFSGDTFVAELTAAGTWTLELSNDQTTTGCADGLG